MKLKMLKTFFTICFSLFIVTWLIQRSMSAQEVIAEGEVKVKGLTLQIVWEDPLKPLIVPINTPTGVGTKLSVDIPQLLRGMIVKGDLRGPGFSKPLTLSTLPNHPFSIPGLPSKGDYFLENIRLERDGKTLLKASPESLWIQSMSVIVTQVETRPLTLKEIREKGINITDENFTVYNFSVGFALESEEIRYDFPVVYTPDEKPYIPPIPRIPSSGGPDVKPVSLPGRQRIPFILKDVNGIDLPQGGSGGSIDSSGNKITGLLIFNNDIAFLNQFFSILLIVSNTAPEGSNLSLKDISATITYPEDGELREAETNPPHIKGTPIPVQCPGPDGKIGTADDLNIILATFSGMAEFLAEGLKEGVHTVEIDFSGTLTGLPSGDTEVSGTALGAVIVKNPEFSITFSHPEVTRYGEEYDIFVTITNISPVPANLVSFTMPATQLVGTKCLDDDITRTFETLEAGQSETVQFHMYSLETGKIRASAFQAEGNIRGRFVIRAGVGEEGIPLSPDTLVLPSYAYILPDTIINPAVIALGEAYSIATTPPGGLPENLPILSREIVETRILDLTEAGQRIKYGGEEKLLESLQVLTLDWLGNRIQDLPFDVLRRLTTKGEKLAQALSAEFNKGLQSTNPINFHKSFAENCSYKAPFFSAQVSFPGVGRSAGLIVSDSYQNRMENIEEEPVREIPYGEYFLMEEGNNNPVDFVLISHIDEDENGLNYSYTLELIREAEGTFDLSLIIPLDSGGFNQVVFSSVQWNQSSRCSITIKPEDETYTLVMQNGETVEGNINPIIEPSLELISAIQDCAVGAAGHVLALFFNRSVLGETANDRDNYSVAGKRVYASFLQPSERIILVGLDSAISPFVEKSILVKNLKDKKTGLVMPDATMPIIATISIAGGVVYGQVLTVDGQPVPNAYIRLDEHENSGAVTRSYTYGDTSGNYQFDFVRILNDPFSVNVTDTLTGKREKITSQIRIHGQRLNLNVYMRGRGTIVGHVFFSSGEPVSDAVVWANAENAQGYEYFFDTTNEHGEFEILDVPLGAVSLRAAWGKQEGLGTLEISSPGEIRDISITLVDILTGTVTGRVLQSDGSTPVEGAGIYLFRNGKPLNFWTTTDNQGFFQIDNVSIGSVTVSAYDPRTNKPGPPVTGSVYANDTFNAVVIFRGTGTITGTVDISNNSELDMSNIIVYIPNSNFLTSPSTDQGNPGFFQFNDVPVGSHTVYAYDKSTFKKVSSKATLLIEGDSYNTYLTFPPPVPTGGIQGYVFGADGTTKLFDTNVIVCDGNYFIMDRVQTNSVDHPSDPGKFQAHDLPVGTYILVVNQGISAGLTRAQIQHGAELVEANVGLLGKGYIKVKVVTKDGFTPIMANVSVTYPDFKFSEGNMIGFVNSQSHYVSDIETGEVMVGPVFTGRFWVEAKNTFYPEGVRTSDILSIPEEVKEVTIEMPERCTVNILVTDYNDEPVGNANLKFTASSYRVDWGTVFTGIGDPNPEDIGKFTFTLVPTGGFSIEAWDEIRNLKGITRSSLVEGQTADVTVKLLGRANVKVRVEDSQGNPVEGAQVKLRNLAYPHESMGEKTKDSTDPELHGTCTFYNVCVGDFAVQAIDNKDGGTGLGGRATGTVTSHGQTVDITITLEPWGIIKGIVYKPDGITPARDAQVKLIKNTTDFGYTVTDYSGSFLFDHIPDGDNYKVSAYDPISAREGSRSVEMELSGQSDPPATVETIIYLQARGKVSGVFYDSSGNPILGAEVTLKNSSDQWQVYTSSGGGFENGFSFEPIPKGAFSLKAFDGASGLYGEATGEIEFEDHHEVVDIYVQSSGTISGTVFENDGSTRVDGAVVYLKRANSIWTRQVTTSSIGDYQVDFVPIGSYTITAYESGGLDNGNTTAQVDFEGQDVSANIIFNGLGTVEGTVYQDGDPVNGATVKVWSGSRFISDNTNQQGEFTFLNIVPVGDFRVEATFNNSSSVVTGTLENDGDSEDVNLVLENTGSVSGNVYLPDEVNKADNAYVVLKHENGTSLYTVTNDQGFFQFETVKQGDFALEIEGYDSSGKAKLAGNINTTGDPVNFDTIILDNIRPQVMNTTPLNGSVNFPVGPCPISVQFSEEMDTSTINTSNIKFLKNGVPVTINEGLNISQDGFQFTPILTDSALYTVSINENIEDKNGNSLVEPFSLNITTLDVTPPIVSLWNPFTNATEVTTSTLITVTFNEPIDYVQGQSPDPFKLEKSGLQVEGQWVFSENKMSLIFTPTSLDANSSYTITVQNFSDFAGNQQSQVFSSTFTTVDTIKPELYLTVTNPPDGSTNVTEGSNVKVTATGSPDIKKVHFYINNVWKFSDNVSPFLYSFSAPLMSESGDSFELKAYAEDGAGNNSDEKIINFNLLTDMPPSVEVFEPASTVVYPNTSITVPVQAQDDIRVETVTLKAMGYLNESTNPTVIFSEPKTVSQQNFNGSFDVTIPLNIQLDSTITLSAEAVDSRGQTSTSNLLNLQVPSDQQVPVVTISSPVQGEEFTHGEELEVISSIEEDIGIRELIVSKFKIDESGQRILPAEWVRNLSAPDDIPPFITSELVDRTGKTEPEEFEFEVIAIDLADKTSEPKSVKVIYREMHSGHEPEITVLSPTNGTLVFPGEDLKVIITANDPDNEGIQSVDYEFYLNDATEAFETIAATYDTVKKYYINLGNPPAIHSDFIEGNEIRIKIIVKDMADETNYTQTFCYVVEGTVLGNGVIIDAGDTTYDGEDKVYYIKGDSEVTINGSHTFKHLLVKENSRLTHTGATISHVEKIEITTIGKIVVGPDAAIDASDKGYLGGRRTGVDLIPNDSDNGRTFDNTSEGGSDGASGGGYGGRGGNYKYSINHPMEYSNKTYGSIYNPSNPGSGGGAYGISFRGGNGGGIIRINALEEVILDGTIQSNGSPNESYFYAGAGSGGSIRLDVPLLKGTGWIKANGGKPTSTYGSGGGGRIAIYYDNGAYYNFDNVIAFGGTVGSIQPSTIYLQGSAGTVYLKKNDETTGQLKINNNLQDSENGTPLVISPSGKITSILDYELCDQNAEFITNSLVGLELQPNINNPATFTIISNGLNCIQTDHGDGSLLSVAQVGDSYRIVGQPINLAFEDGVAHFTGNSTINNLNLYNATLILDGHLNVDQLFVEGGSIITHSITTIAKTYSLSIEADQIYISANSRINTDGKGYPGGREKGNETLFGRTFPNTNENGSGYASGGSYGGFGGQNSSHNVNGIYGSIYTPDKPGSGGGAAYNSSYWGTSGGGVIKIKANTLTLDGEISSYGISNISSTPLDLGTGSGGSIWIDVTNLEGTGSLKANGGNSSGDYGSGGGGRIAIYYNQESSDFDLTNVTTFGGMTNDIPKNKDYLNGSPGTIYLKEANSEGKLVINNNGNDSNTPLIFPVIKQGIVTDVTGDANNVLVNENADYMPGSLVDLTLIPDINNNTPEGRYTIIDNDKTTITVDRTLNLDLENNEYNYKGVLVFIGHIILQKTISDLQGDVELENITVKENSRLGHPECTIDSTSFLFITASTKITIENGSKISVSGRGYLGGYRGDNTDEVYGIYGKTLNNEYVSSLRSGGSYGGKGGRYYSSEEAGGTYGSLYEPVFPGAGGGAHVEDNGTIRPGGNGGGVIIIKSEELLVDGNIFANGDHFDIEGLYARGGSGSGGSVWLDVNTITGIGSIAANGSNAPYHAAGGGGRIAIYYNNMDQFTISNISAHGGKRLYQPQKYTEGGAGTIFLKDKSSGQADLIIDNINIDTYVQTSREYSTELPSVAFGLGQDYSTSLEDYKLENTNINFVPGALKGIKLNPNILNDYVYTIISNTNNEIRTDPDDGKLTDYGGTGNQYIGEHHLFNLTVKGMARVLTTDRIIVSPSGTLTVESGSKLKSANLEQ